MPRAWGWREKRIESSKRWLWQGGEAATDIWRQPPLLLVNWAGRSWSLPEFPKRCIGSRTLLMLYPETESARSTAGIGVKTHGRADATAITGTNGKREGSRGQEMPIIVFYAWQEIIILNYDPALDPKTLDWKSRGWRNSQRLKVCTVLHRARVQRRQVSRLITTSNSSSRVSDALFRPLQELHLLAQTHTQIDNMVKIDN